MLYSSRIVTTHAHLNATTSRVRDVKQRGKQLLRIDIKHFLLCCFILTSLSNCGFHLRGIADVPRWLNHIAIIVKTENRHLEPLLTEQLEAYKIIVSPPNTKAAYRLIIESDTLQKQITNVSASQTPRQYLLLYTVRFTLLSASGVTVIPSTNLIITRQFTLNNDRILGSNYEEMTFKREMEAEAASQIISRLSSSKEITLPKNTLKSSHDH